MLKWRINRTIDLTGDAMRVERLRALATLSTRVAHELHIHVLEDKKDARLDGLTVKLSVILPDKSSLMDDFDGRIDGYETVMILPNICYSQSGEVKGVLYLEDGKGGMLPIYAFVLMVYADLTDIFIDHANVVPSISELLAQIETMKLATQDANDAANKAIAAAAYAQSLVIDASGCAANAEKLAGKLPSEFLGANDTAADSEKLGGRDADEYVLKEELTRAEDTYVTPQMFGFGNEGNDVEANSAAVQAAFDSGKCVLFPPGDYQFCGVTCDHDVYVQFVGANLVPVHPAYDPNTLGGSNLVTRAYGVFENFFAFTGCDVTMEGLALLADEEARGRENGVSDGWPPTRSIAEFDSCRVTLRGWHVRGLSLFNRGKTPSAFYERKGIIFSAIDTDILVQDCLFENIQGDEWTWTTHRDDIYATKCTFDRCTFRSPFTVEYGMVSDGSTAGIIKPGLTCTNIFMVSEAVVQNCTFEDIAYNGSLANVVGLRGVFRNNVISNCTVGGVADFMEGTLYLFANEVIMENNVMMGSTCNTFAKIGTKRGVIRGNSGVVAEQFVWAYAPYSNNTIREDPVSSIHYLIEDNDAICTGLVAGETNAFLFLQLTRQTGIWSGNDCEVLIRRNRFKRTGSIQANCCIRAIDVNKMIVRDNDLFFGTLHNSTASAYAAQLVGLNITAQHGEFVSNVLDSSTIASTATSASSRGMVMFSGTGTKNIESRNYLNVMSPAIAAVELKTSGVASGCVTTEISEGNIGFNG